MGSGFRSGIRFQCIRVAALRQSGFDLPHRFSFQNDFVSVVNEPVQGGIGRSGFAHDSVPGPDRQLAGDHIVTALTAVVHQFAALSG